MPVFKLIGQLILDPSTVIHSTATTETTGAAECRQKHRQNTRSGLTSNFFEIPHKINFFYPHRCHAGSRTDDQNATAGTGAIS